jgi:hypothetical protein
LAKCLADLPQQQLDRPSTLNDQSPSTRRQSSTSTDQSFTYPNYLVSTKFTVRNLDVDILALSLADPLEV